MLFHESEWKKRTVAFDPDNVIQFEDEDKTIKLEGVASSLSFILGAHKQGVGMRIPDTLVFTISEAKAKLGEKEFDLNAPIRISTGLTSVDIASSAQGERAFHSNIITALRILLRLRLHPGKTDFNYI
ncbi:hypothetical protein PFISCL1PPCAC_703, partial [Pristionchus fissidentatus]